MADRHLNLFYSYNRSPSEELIEDNLTRAFIQVLRGLSPGTCGWFLHRLLDTRDANLGECDFARADFALQDRLTEPAHEFKLKRIVTMSTRAPEAEDGEPSEVPTGGSRPDAWVYDSNSEIRSYCLLIECKRGENPIDSDQLRRHAQEWFHLPLEEVGQSSLEWYDVLNAIEAAKELATGPSRQELHLLAQLEQFLGFFDYRLFKGFRFDKRELTSSPDWRLFHGEARHGLFRLDELHQVPEFSLCRAREGALEQGGLLHFDRLKPAPTFKLRGATGTTKTVTDWMFRFGRLGPVPAFNLINKKGDKHGR